MSTPSKTKTDADPPSALGILRKIATTVEAIAAAISKPPIDPALRCYTAAEAAEAMGVTENWVLERMNDQSIPFTYIGKFRRMRVKHILAVVEAGEVDPRRRGRKTLTSAA